jgi:hypothetical protein
MNLVLLLFLAIALQLFLLATWPSFLAHLPVVPLGLLFLVLASLVLYRDDLVTIALRAMAGLLLLLASAPGYQPATTKVRFTPGALALCTVAAIWSLAIRHVA